MVDGVPVSSGNILGSISVEAVACTPLHGLEYVSRYGAGLVWPLRSKAAGPTLLDNVSLWRGSLLERKSRTLRRAACILYFEEILTVHY